MANDASAAAALISTGRFDAALKLLATLPRNSEGLDGLLGAAYLGRKQAKAAIRHLEQALDLAPGDEDLTLSLGKALLLANDPGAAISQFEGLSSSPRRDEALAGAYRRDARLKDCIRLVESVPSPSIQMSFERAMSLNGLGDAPRALSAWDELTIRVPDLAAAWYGSHGPALDLQGWTEAERRLERAASCPKANGRYEAMAAAYDVLAGRKPRLFGPKHSHIVESAAALVPHLEKGWRLFGTSAALLTWALGEAHEPGLVLEFGVRRGTSLSVIAAQAGQEVHGFDSFEGLPEAWGATHAGVLTTGGLLPQLGPDAKLHPGWFEDTLPAFLSIHGGNVRFANIDSDIYSSARTVLNGLAGRIRPGTVLVFDEFIGNRTWRDDEYRAFAEFVADNRVNWRVIAVTPCCKQVAVRIT